MPPRTISYTDLPGTSRLFLDYLYEPSKTRDFYAQSRWEPVDYPADRRAADPRCRRRGGELGCTDSRRFG